MNLARISFAGKRKFSRRSNYKLTLHFVDLSLLFSRLVYTEKFKSPRVSYNDSSKYLPPSLTLDESGLHARVFSRRRNLDRFEFINWRKNLADKDSEIHNASAKRIQY